ncbi:hypothetical protein B6U96_14260 [Archaeoglobales archaeon ex4484_92]|nr:MAG: hypothetical protein B6U96_14260 [Archaeoglobales archaeon ex4484_92]
MEDFLIIASEIAVCRMDGSGTWNYFSGVVSQITKERACRKDWREALVEGGVYAFVRHLEFLGTY